MQEIIRMINNSGSHGVRIAGQCDNPKKQKPGHCYRIHVLSENLNQTELMIHLLQVTVNFLGCVVFISTLLYSPAADLR